MYFVQFSVNSDYFRIQHYVIDYSYWRRGVFCAVRTKILNIVYMHLKYGLRGLNLAAHKLTTVQVTKLSL
jgi:hypothetical protein